MSRRASAVLFVGLSVLSFAASASADTLRCQSVNGNINCAGSSGMSCQTINGKTVCVSGHGDVVQSFGKGSPPDMRDDGADVRGWGNDLPDLNEQ